MVASVKLVVTKRPSWSLLMSAILKDLFIVLNKGFCLQQPGATLTVQQLGLYSVSLSVFKHPCKEAGIKIKDINIHAREMLSPAARSIETKVIAVNVS